LAAGDITGQAKAYSSLAFLHSYMKNHKAALDAAKISSSIFFASKDKSWHADGESLLGAVKVSVLAFHS